MVSPIVKVFSETVLDVVLLTFIFKIDNWDDLNTAVKFFTSILILVITIFRLYYFCRDFIDNKKTNTTNEQNKSE